MITLKSCPRCAGATYDDFEGPTCLMCGMSGDTRDPPTWEPEGRIEHMFDHSRRDAVERYREAKHSYLLAKRQRLLDGGA